MIKKQKAKLKGLLEERCYATRYWNNDDKYAAITKWDYDVDSSYRTFQKKTSEYDNAEWIEQIIHSISARGTEACDVKEPRWVYDKKAGDKIISGE